MAAKDPERRSAAAKIASLHSWARTPDRTARTRKARRAAWDRWETEVDPDGVMTPENRRKAADARRRAHFVKMGRRSAEARRAKKNAA